MFLSICSQGNSIFPSNNFNTGIMSSAPSGDSDNLGSFHSKRYGYQQMAKGNIFLQEKHLPGQTGRMFMLIGVIDVCSFSMISLLQGK